MDLSGKTALVTGSARRVGRAIALELARAGCDLAVHFHKSTGEADALVEEIRRLGPRCVAVQGDLGEPQAAAEIVEQTVGQLGRLDVLVNNAAVFESLPMDDWNASAWARVLQINTIAPAMLARAAVPHMRRAGSGRIVNITDISAERPIRGFAAYCASKAALVNLTQSLARELAPQITVNAVSPGIAAFPDSYDDALRDRLVRRVPLQRSGTPEDIARAVRFLVADGDYMTGQVLVVDGGRSVVP
jgi:pteridine reductase